MRFLQRIGILILTLLSVNVRAQSPEQKLTVTGKLVRVMAIGGESTGWAIELDSGSTVDHRQINSIQVRYRSSSKLEKLANKQVRATGKLVHRQGIETGEAACFGHFLHKRGQSDGQYGAHATKNGMTTGAFKRLDSTDSLGRWGALDPKQEKNLSSLFLKFVTMSCAGWVARRRPLAGPLSPRGSQPVLRTLRWRCASPYGPRELARGYASCSTKVPSGWVSPDDSFLGI